MKFYLRFITVVTTLSALVACGDPPASFTAAVTTSVEDSGLLRHLAARFHEDQRIDVQWVAVGSGRALEMERSIS